ncbi:MAG TPA: HEPN domain-containing protein [Chitinophagaceae bacterium]|nr:HEPN domain-containing protein [Chitinophagaceae bacterium]
MAFENDIKRIDKRDWSKLCDKWLSFIPSFSYPGEAPEHQILDFVGLEAIYHKTQSAQGGLKIDVPLLRQEVLREAIYFVHKSTHVCGAANIHLENGALSWAISSAYQSSFFALKGILGLLGLSFPRINTSLMVDCFPEEEKLSSKQRKRGEIPRQEFKFVVLPKLSHKHMWQIFQRVLYVSKIELWREEIVSYLRHIDIDKFSEQRNSLHYKNDFWLFPEDLFKRVFDPSFGVFENLFTEANYDRMDSKKDFSFILNYILLKFAIDLIKDLGKNATSINEEYNVILNTLKEGIHTRFLSCVNLD